MTTKQHTEKTATLPGSVPVRDTPRPVTRIYDTGCYDWPPVEYDAISPPFNPLGAMLAAAVAVRWNAADAPAAGSTLIVSPYETQPQLHAALSADLGLSYETSILNEPDHKRADLVVLDLSWPSSCADTDGTLGAFRFDSRFADTAFTAARFETIVLGDMRDFQSQLPVDAPLRRRLDTLEQSGTEVESFPEALLQPAADLWVPGISFFLDLEEAYHAIHEDVRAAQHQIIWNFTEVAGDDDILILQRPGLEQVLLQPLNSDVVRRREEQGFRVDTDHRGESAIFVDDDLFWLIGSPRMWDLVRPFVRVRGRRIARIMAELYDLGEWFKVAPTP